MQFDAVLFDMDGLLIDSEVVAAKAFTETAADYGLPDVYDLFLSLVGCNENTHKVVIEKALGKQIDTQQFRIDWTARYHESLQGSVPPLLPGVTELLDWLRGNKIPCVVATSSTADAAAYKLQGSGIRDYFTTVTSGDDVEFSKPNPEIFLKAAASIDADPVRALVLEDSENGVRAAVAANTQVIQVPNLVPPSAELMRLGHTVCNDLTEVLTLVKLHHSTGTVLPGRV